MPTELAALVACLLCLIGIAGIVVPVLPGSVTVIVGLLVWAVWGSAPLPWLWFAGGAALVVVGMTASYLITGRNLSRRGIPSWPVMVALLVGVVVGFIIPGFGLLIGFVGSLLLIELVRVRNLRAAWSTSWVAIKSVGAGMAIELLCALAATTTLAISLFVALV